MQAYDIAQCFSNTFGRGPKKWSKKLGGPLMSQMTHFSLAYLLIGGGGGGANRKKIARGPN